MNSKPNDAEIKHANSQFAKKTSANNNTNILSDIIRYINAIPCILTKLDTVANSVSSLQRESGMLRDLAIKGSDHWMDADEARRYLSVSKNTFDNYRYNFTPRLPGHLVGGKALYKKSDVDHWVLTYQWKSADRS